MRERSARPRSAIRTRDASDEDDESNEATKNRLKAGFLLPRCRQILTGLRPKQRQRPTQQRPKQQRSKRHQRRLQQPRRRSQQPKRRLQQRSNPKRQQPEPKQPTYR
jgi:hypothetical protein